MEPIFRQTVKVDDQAVDRYGRLKSSMMLYYAQEVAGAHCNLLALDYDSLARRRLFWAVIRHKVQITRRPLRGEVITLETWPMPTTRVAYPRSVVAYDSQGNECFRSISLWVIMDLDTRNMILPGKTGISVLGTLRGGELPAPNSLVPRTLGASRERIVAYTDLDRNGHMNNTRYLDWIDDLMPSPFHRDHSLRGFTVCYLSEALEGQTLQLQWELSPQMELRVDGLRTTAAPENTPHRVFAAQLEYQ